MTTKTLTLTCNTDACPHKGAEFTVELPVDNDGKPHILTEEGVLTDFTGVFCGGCGSLIYNPEGTA